VINGRAYLGFVAMHKICCLQHMGSTGAICPPTGAACKIARNIDLSLLKTLKIAETPGFFGFRRFD